MQNIKKDNPAGRVFHIFKDTQGTNETETTIGQVWTKVFSLPSPDPVIVAEHRRLVIRLIDDTKKFIKRKSDINHTLFLGSLPDIKNIMEETNIDSPWSLISSILSDKSLTELAFCADALSDMEIPIKKGELEGITKKVEAFAKKTKQATNCEDDIKELLESIVNFLQRGIRDYHIIGAIALQETLAVCIGRLFVMRCPGFAGEKETELLSYIKDLLTHIDWVVGQAFNNKSLFENVAPLLPGTAIPATESIENGDNRWIHSPEEVGAVK
jgi:hypothetical protein